MYQCKYRVHYICLCLEFCEDDLITLKIFNYSKLFKKTNVEFHFMILLGFDTEIKCSIKLLLSEFIDTH